VLERARTGSRPDRRTDGARVALCIEGGAMRGVVSAGMVVALQRLGLIDVFDAVYGSSAGAMNGAYLLARQALFGTTIYYEDINNARFVDFRRVVRGRPILNLDYLVGEVMNERKRLDVDAVAGSAVPLKVLATHVPSGERHVFSSWDGRDDFLRSLRAGASMPIVAGPPYRYRGEPYWDALLTEPIPVHAAAGDGVTHIVTLLTRAPGGAGPALSAFDRLFILPRVRKASALLADRYVARGEEYSRLVASLWNETMPGGQIAVLPIGPSGQVAGKLEKTRATLMASARAGAQAVFAAFSSDPAPADILGVG